MALFVVVLGMEPARAQQVGACAPAEADAYLDVNDVRARIFNDGPLFWRGEPGVYHVPRDDSVNALFTASIWLGGIVNGEVRAAGALYARYEFWPGPLDDAGAPPADCAPYDRIYEITTDDLAAYYATGALSDNLRGWPRALGAPVVDGDGDPDNYDPAAGDRPALLGDQMLWWVMNDAGNTHDNTGSLPIGMEVHGSAWSFRRFNVLDRATFYRYRLVYKGAAPLEDAYFGLWIDADLGNFADDYYGADTLLHLGYFYNADNDDEGEHGYGLAPPAVGATFLHGAPADADGRDNDRNGQVDEPGERAGLSAFVCVKKSFPPSDAREFYHHLQGLTREGDPQYVGGDYWQNDFSDVPTPYCYPGDPVTGAFWSMENIDGAGTPLFPHDVRFLMSTGPFTMQPGEAQDIAFAIVWSRGVDRLDSVRKLKAETTIIRRAAPSLLAPALDAILPASPPQPVPVFPLGFAQAYPNPFSSATVLRYSLPQEMQVRLRVYDVLGREVAMLVDERQPPGLYEIPFDASGLPGGVYLYRIEMDHLRATKTMILLR